MDCRSNESGLSHPFYDHIFLSRIFFGRHNIFADSIQDEGNACSKLGYRGFATEGQACSQRLGTSPYRWCNHDLSTWKHFSDATSHLKIYVWGSLCWKAPPLFVTHSACPCLMGSRGTHEQLAHSSRHALYLGKRLWSTSIFGPGTKRTCPVSIWPFKSS